jgi:hypothetical protein
MPPAVYLEPLEARIAPATLVNPTTITFQDIDGDNVTLKFSKPVFLLGTINNVLKFDTGIVDGDNTVKQQLQLIDFTALTNIAAAAGANLTISAAKRPGGDGLVNVGAINATGVDLGKVSDKGDLGQIDVGDNDTATAGLASLSVRSLGRYGLSTQGGAGELISTINGSLGVLKVIGDVKEASVIVTGGGDVKLGLVSIGGSLMGGGAIEGGRIVSDGDMGRVTIAKDVIGGTGNFSGNISAGGKLAGLTIRGSLVGGTGDNSGRVDDNFGTGLVQIGKDVRGGVGANSGQIHSSALVKIGKDLIGGDGPNSGLIMPHDEGSVQIAGNMIGGRGEFSGSIIGTALVRVSVGGSAHGGLDNGSGSILCTSLGRITIGHDLIGGSVSGSASMERSGCIRVAVDLTGGVIIGGSIIAGRDDSTGTLADSGAIRVGNVLGPVTVKGSIIGNETQPVLITAGGNPDPAIDLAITKITVGGRVERAQILAGYGTAGTPNAVDADVSVGPVSVGSDWIASNLVAGVEDGTDNLFGTADDTLIAGGLSNVVARIAKVTIKGVVVGTVGTGDHFGFVAQQIGTFKAGSFLASLTGGPDVIELSPITGDLTLREVS